MSQFSCQDNNNSQNGYCPTYVDDISQPSFPELCEEGYHDYFNDNNIIYNFGDNAELAFCPQNADDIMDLNFGLFTVVWEYYQAGYIQRKDVCEMVHNYEKYMPGVWKRLQLPSWYEIMAMPPSGQVEPLNNNINNNNNNNNNNINDFQSNNNINDFQSNNNWPPIEEYPDIDEGDILPSPFVISTLDHPPHDTRKRITNPCTNCQTAKRKCTEKEICERCKKDGTPCIRTHGGKRSRRSAKNASKKRKLQTN